MSSIFDINSRLRQCYEMAESGEYDEETVTNTIKCIEFELEEKADQYAYYITELNGEIAMLREEKERISALIRSRESFIKRLKANLLGVMIQTGKTKIKTLVHSVWIQKNPASVHVYDISKLQDNIELWKPRKWDEDELDKTKIKEMILAGVNIPGAEIKQSEGLRIR